MRNEHVDFWTTMGEALKCGRREDGSFHPLGGRFDKILFPMLLADFNMFHSVTAL
jgi:hypothetical protein